MCVVLFVFIGGQGLFSNVWSWRALSRSFHTYCQKDIHSEVTNGCLVVLSETFWWSLVKTYKCDTVMSQFKNGLDRTTNFSYLSRSRVSRLGSTRRICSLIFNISDTSTSHVSFPRRFPVDRIKDHEHHAPFFLNYDVWILMITFHLRENVISRNTEQNLVSLTDIKYMTKIRSLNYNVIHTHVVSMTLHITEIFDLLVKRESSYQLSSLSMQSNRFAKMSAESRHYESSRGLGDPIPGHICKTTRFNEQELLFDFESIIFVEGQ